MTLDDLIEKIPPSENEELFSDWLDNVDDFVMKHNISDIGIHLLSAKINMNGDLETRKMFREKIKNMLREYRSKMANIESRLKVFIVHGHDDALKLEVARLLEQQGIDPIILHEQTNQGRVLLDKLEQEISRASFAVVLYTKDDMVSSLDGSVWRARQNVVFEHGYLIASLGRDKVCAIKDEDVEMMSDISGVTYISRSDPWQIKLLNELKGAGFSVDLNKAKF